MGNNVIVLWAGQTSMQAGGQRAGRPVKFEYEDIEAIREEVPIVRAVSAEVDRDFGFKRGTRVVSLNVRGVELPYGQMRKLDLDEGRYFNETDFTEHHRVVILGYDANKRVFQGAPSVGQPVSIGGLDFSVIGVMRNKIQDSMYEGPDNQDGFIPYGLFRDLKDIRDPDMIIFQPASAELHKQALAAVREVVRDAIILIRAMKKPRPNGTPSTAGRSHRVLAGAASRARADRSSHAGSWRCRRDEHHVGFRDRTNARNRPAQSPGSATKAGPDAVSSGSTGADIRRRCDGDGAGHLPHLGNPTYAALQRVLQDRQP